MWGIHSSFFYKLNLSGINQQISQEIIKKGFSIQSLQCCFYCNLRHTIDVQKTFPVSFSESLHLLYYFVNEKLQTLVSPNIVTMLCTYCSRLPHPHSLYTLHLQAGFSLCTPFSSASLSYHCEHDRNPELGSDRLHRCILSPKKKTAEVQDASISSFLKNILHHLSPVFIHCYQASVTSWHQNTQR